MARDFSNARLPNLAPLAASFAENDVEDELKQLFLDVFRDALAEDAFDANVLGAAHLGSFDLVKQVINTDGLVLLPGEREEASTRYLYRAWKSGNNQGRGLHFLRTYLQMLFPGIGEAVQLWHRKGQPYPTALLEAQADDTYLTSRIRINVSGFPDADSDQRILNCIVQVVPARFVIDLRYTATSAINPLRIASIGTLMQRLNTEGELDNVLNINSSVSLKTTSFGTPARLFRTFGDAS